MWVRIQAHSSNLLAAIPTPVEEGMIVTGIVTATYGTHLTATLNTWRPSKLKHWQNETSGYIKNPRPVTCHLK